MMSEELRARGFCFSPSERASEWELSWKPLGAESMSKHIFDLLLAREQLDWIRSSFKGQLRRWMPFRSFLLLLNLSFVSSFVRSSSKSYPVCFDIWTANTLIENIGLVTEPDCTV